MIDDIMQDAEQRMKKSLDALAGELSKIRTGRAHPSLLDHIRVDYYGSEVPLSQVANINVEDARTLALSPWEKTMVQVVEKAIMQSDLGLTPTTSGQIIRVPLPPLTEERRKQLGKVVAHEGEQAKVAVRNIRRDANSSLKDLEKEKEISEDDLRRSEDSVQKLTDRYVEKVDEMVKVKEKELLEI
jgi:ribosome recycling factor